MGPQAGSVPPAPSSPVLAPSCPLCQPQGQTDRQDLDAWPHWFTWLPGTPQGLPGTECRLFLACPLEESGVRGSCQDREPTAAATPFPLPSLSATTGPQGREAGGRRLIPAPPREGGPSLSDWGSGGGT